MQTIKRDIYVTKNVLQAPIEVTEGTNSIAIEFDVRDYDIPASAAAVAYSLSTSSMEEPNKALADVSGNKITIIPSETFFLPGQNVMQVRIIDGNSKLISFNIIVKCTGKMRFGDEKEAQQSTLVEQMLAKLGEYQKKSASPYNFKGSCLSSELPASGNTINDTYYCTDLKYRKTWNGSAWEQSSLNEADYEDELTKTNGEVSSLKEDLAGLGDTLGGLPSLDFIHGTIYNGRYAGDGTYHACIKEYTSFDYDVTIDVKSGYSFGLQKKDSSGTVVDEYGNSTTVMPFTSAKQTITKGTQFRIFARKNDAVYGTPCDIEDVKYSLTIKGGIFDYIIDNRIQPLDSSTYAKTLNNYETGKITIEKIGFSNNSVFPSKAGILYTFNEWSADMGYQVFKAYDNKGIWYRKFNSNGIALEWFKFVTNFDLNIKTSEHTTRRIKRVPMITFIDDDGSVQVYNRYRSLASKHNVKFCASLHTYRIGKQGYMNWEQVEELYNDYGFEFLVHSHNEEDYTVLTDTEIVNQMNLCKQALLDHNIKVRGIAYPNQRSNKKVREYASQYFDYGFKGEAKPNTYQVNYGCIPSFYITRCIFGCFFDSTGNVNGTPVYSPTDTNAPDGAIRTNSLDYYKLLVDDCIAKNGWLVFNLHAWHEDFDETQFQYLDELISYAKENGVYISDCSTAYDMFKNELEVGDYLGRWNEEGMAINKEGLIDSVNRVTSGIANWNYDKFPENQTTTYSIPVASSDGFPETGGLYEVHKYTGKDFSFALYYCALSNNVYKRKFDSNGNPLQWVKIMQQIN